MIYRIDYEKFLIHMIDHFTRDEILHMQYAIISAQIINSGHSNNTVKFNDLYPDPEIVCTYAETHDKELMRKMYMNQLESKDDEMYLYQVEFLIYKIFLNPLELHQNICIICGKSENDFIDVLCEFLKKNFGIEVIDLNQLFTTGRVGSIYIDRDEIHDRCVTIRRAAEKTQKEALETTKEGRAELVHKHMKKKDKIRTLNKLGITPTSTKTEYLNELLTDAYVNNDEDGD